MLELIKLIVVVTVVYTGAQALGKTINKLEVKSGKQQKLISQIKGLKNDN